MTKEQIQQYQEIEAQISEAKSDLARVNDFLKRGPNNVDTANAVKNGKIFVKFAGTGCYLPVGMFNGALTQQKKDLENLIIELEDELAGL